MFIVLLGAPGSGKGTVGKIIAEDLKLAHISTGDLFRENLKNKDNEISIDKTGKKEGRGAYICDDVKCLEKLQKSKRLERVFEMQISQEIYESLRGVILDK